MPRKGAVPKRDVLPDPVYNSKTVTRFINKIMLSGKKSVAQGIVYAAFETMGTKTGKDPLELFETALKNVNKSFHSYAGKGILTKNTAARRVSRLAQLVNTLGSVAA